MHCSRQSYDMLFPICFVGFFYWSFLIWRLFVWKQESRKEFSRSRKVMSVQLEEAGRYKNIFQVQNQMVFSQDDISFLVQRHRFTSFSHKNSHSLL